MQIIEKYFPHLNKQQQQQFAGLNDLYSGWNSRINLISRKDIGNLYERHVLHSLSIAKFLSFRPGTKIMDVGTGGGFPGIPLAILFPACKFLLLDSIGKKIRAVQDIAQQLDLRNVDFSNKRAEEEKTLCDFAVSRATMSLQKLVKICHKNISEKQQNAIPNGFICLKGDRLEEEITVFRKGIETFPISDYFEEEFFRTKKIVYLPNP